MSSHRFLRCAPPFLSICLILLLLPLCLEAQGPTDAAYPCEPSPAVKEELRKTRTFADVRITAEERSEQREQLLDSIIARYPNDLFVHRRYQDIMQRRIDRDPKTVILRYEDLLNKHPKSAEYLELYGRALAGYYTADAQKYLEQALRRAQDFAWPHLDLAEQVYDRGPYRDPAKMQANLEAFMKACPYSLEPYSDLGRTDDHKFLKEASNRLRTLLEADGDPEALGYYGDLWDLEFRTAVPSEHDRVRNQVAADLAKLSSLNLTQDQHWYSTLHYGYQLLDDQAGQRWVESELSERYPDSELTIRFVTARWHDGNPAPNLTDPPEKRKAFNQKLLSVTDDWIRRWPDYPGPWFGRLHALDQMEDSQPAEVEAAGEGLLKAMARNHDLMASMPTPPMQVAEVYVKKGIKLETVPQLVEEGINEAEAQIHREAESDLNPPESKHMLDNELNFVHWKGLTVLTDAYLKLKNSEKAQDVLAQMEAFLAQHKPGQSATPGQKSAYVDHSKEYWEKMAKFAESGSHKVDALAYYQNALGFLAQQSSADKKEDKSAAKAKELWQELGGTDQGWRSWEAQQSLGHSESSTPESQWSKLDQPLPEFDLASIGGRNWRLADLKGKVAFVNIWTTWCGPCRGELPYIQKLYEEVKDRKDVLVLTLNDDENPGLAEQFVKTHDYSFPVLLAHGYLDQIVPLGVYPRNWILDRNSVRRLEEEGFGFKGDDWVKDVLANLNKLEVAK